MLSLGGVGLLLWLVGRVGSANLVLIPETTENITDRIVLDRTLHIAGLYDLTNFPNWPEHYMNFAVRLINDKTDGWHDDVLTDGSLLDFTMNDSACDPDTAVRAYLARMRDGGPRPHGIFGCRCSGETMDVARLAAVEKIPILSPSSTSVKLSDKAEYATFSRLVGPDNHRGQVGALIRLLRTFGWDRISILNTDTEFTNDIALELSDAWKGQHVGDDPFLGEISYTDTIKLNKTTNLIDQDSAKRVLSNVPVHKPAINSRVIVLFAHNQHAFPILKCAHEMGFQPDTIWVGTSEWVGRDPVLADADISWMPSIPGYLGVMPYRNQTSTIYLDFLARLQRYEAENGIQPITQDLPDYVADRVVDAVVAFAKAFDSLPLEDRYDGGKVSVALRSLRFEGLSGPIAFDEAGDFVDARYTVLTMASKEEGWSSIGYATPSMSFIATEKVCYAEVGCVASIPTDTYPLEKERLPIWIWIIVTLLAVITLLCLHQRRQSVSVTAKLARIEHELAALDDNDDAVKRKKGRLYREIATLLDQPMPEHWTKNNNGDRVVSVTPLEAEYWQVLEKLRETMTPGETCHLSALSRIQNDGIWSYYVFRKNQLANKYGVDLSDTRTLREVSVWHGTSSLNPDVIYQDEQDGFMMQLSQQGHWGRGIYFSERSGYSDPYSFKPLTEYSDSQQIDRELFLVKLLVGDAILLDRMEGEWMAEACNRLVTPPDNPNYNGYKFDTVTGIVDDEAKTKVYVVYENGRAYPEYLVRYYKGDRDPSRTPFETWEEVQEELKNQEAEAPKETPASFVFRQLQDSSRKLLEQSRHSLGLPSADSSKLLVNNSDDASVDKTVNIAPVGIWQYQNDNNEWINYLNGHQIQLEKAYQQDNRGVTTIELFPWTYAVDFSVNLQTNLDQQERRTRKIRRIHLTHLDDSHPNARSSATFRFSTYTKSGKHRVLHPEAILEGLVSVSMDDSSSVKSHELGGETPAGEETGSAPSDGSALSPPDLESGTALSAATTIRSIPADRDGEVADSSSICARGTILPIVSEDSVDAGTGTADGTLRSAMTDEQAASIVSSLASLYSISRDVSEGNLRYGSNESESLSRLYPSARDVANAGTGNIMRAYRTEPIPRTSLAGLAIANSSGNSAGSLATRIARGDISAEPHP